jgi:hypothetical protein
MSKTTIQQPVSVNEAESKAGFAAPSGSASLRVEAAAKRQPDGKIIIKPPPARHDDLEGYGEKGFLLSDGTWCNRAQAESVARQSGQLKGPIRHAHLKGLSTDDLW